MDGEIRRNATILAANITVAVSIEAAKLTLQTVLSLSNGDQLHGPPT